MQIPKIYGEIQLLHIISVIQQIAGEWNHSSKGKDSFHLWIAQIYGEIQLLQIILEEWFHSPVMSPSINYISIN